MPTSVDRLMGKTVTYAVLEADAGRQFMSSGAYDSVPFNIYRGVYSDGTVDESLDSTAFGGQVQRTQAIKIDGTVLVSGKLNHPHIP